MKDEEREESSGSWFWIIIFILLICGQKGYLIHGIFGILVFPVLILLGYILKLLWTFK